MKKRNLMVALLCSMCLVASTPMPAMADATKVVTLGADLSEDQRNTMMKIFQGRFQSGTDHFRYQSG